MRVPVDDMFVMKQLNPLNPFMRGLGPAESIADEVEIDEYAAKFQKRFFYNDATPPVVFLMPDATDDQRNAFMARWNQKHRGVENSHRAAALTGNVEVKELGSTDGKNLGFIESREAMRNAVLEHFGVPREIMGITENSNRSTADAAQYIYAKNVLTPRLANREEAINTQLLPMFGSNLVWRYDAIIPYDRDFDKQKALDAYNAGLITRNEARELLDLPDIDGGDVYKVSINDLFLGEDEDPAAVSQALLQDTSLPPAEGEQKGRRVNMTAALKHEELAIRKQQALFEVAVTRHFAEQRDRVEKALGLKTKAATDVFNPIAEYLLPDGTFDPLLWAALSEADQLRLSEAVAAGLLNWNDEVQSLMQVFMPLWKQAYNAGAELNAETYGLRDLQRPEFISAAKVNGGKRIVGIENTTKHNIADIVAKAIANGSNQESLQKEILSEMTITQSRAKIIARQETSTALATGQFDIMRKAGATSKTWRHRNQKDPRDGTNGRVNHVILDGETVGINERFSNGLRFPRDPEDNRPEQLINCRCYLTYDFGDTKAMAWDEGKHPRGDDGRFIPSGGGFGGGGSSGNSGGGSSGGSSSGGSSGSGSSGSSGGSSGSYQKLASDDDANAYWAGVDSGEIDPSDTSTIPDWWEKQSSQMTVSDSEREAINKGYVGNDDSYEINSAMRESPNKPLSEILSGEKLEAAQALESAISKNTLSQDTVLTRYVSENFLDSCFGLSENDFFAIQRALDRDGNLDAPRNTVNARPI